jgi:hypothetical protein
MKIFHAIDNAEIVPLFFDKTGIKANIMISYYYLEGNATKLTKTYRHMIDTLYLDSGAFSSFTGKGKISVREYRLYLQRYGHLFDQYFNLDDAFDDVSHNQANQEYLEDGLKDAKPPIPVIHDASDPLAEAKFYIACGSRYIALGSMGLHKRIPPTVMEQLKEEHPEVKVHIFGSLNRKILEQYRPYSADSSAWAQQSGKAGAIYYWRVSGNKGYTYYVGGRDSKKSTEQHLKRSPFFKEIEEFLYRTFRYTYADLLKSADAKRIVNLYFFHQYEDYLNSLG